MSKPFSALLILALVCGAFTYSPTVHSEAVQKRSSLVAAFDVRRFGAKGDRKTLDSLAINKAIDAAAAAGGGTVLITAGTYRAFPPKAGPFGYPNARDAVEPGWGNKSISLKHCRNVIIRDISILHGGHFAILATGVASAACRVT